MFLPESKKLIIDTVKRVQDADEKLSSAALDILADVLLDSVAKEYRDTAFKKS